MASGDLYRQLSEKRFVFFGGKGGVGKTTCASGFALLCADAGHRTLVVSTDPAHSTADVFRRPIGTETRSLEPNLWGMEIDPEREADRYMEQVSRSLRDLVHPHMYDEINRHVDAARAAPGAVEAALFDRLVSVMEEAEYDRVVFDTAPTGHTVRLLTLPDLMSAWTDMMLEQRHRGQQLQHLWRQQAEGDEREGEAHQPADRIAEILRDRRRRFYRARRLLFDPALTAFVFVLNAEPLPIRETHRAVRQLDEHGVPVAGMIVNRVLPADSTDAFWRRRKEQERHHLGEVEHRFGAWPIARVPMFDRDVQGLGALRAVGHAFRSG